MKRYGLIGYPLGHSFSARYFADKFAREGIADCRYDLYELKTIEELPALLEAQPELRGFNVTIPYKQQIIPYLDDLSPETRMIGAVNCVRCEGRRLTGYNTDVTGLRASLETFLGGERPERALVLGTGGASQAVQYVLAQMEIPFDLVSRNPATGNYTYDEVSDEVIGSHRLIINASQSGCIRMSKRRPAFRTLSSRPPLSFRPDLQPGRNAVSAIRSATGSTHVQRTRHARRAGGSCLGHMEPIRDPPTRLDRSYRSRFHFRRLRSPDLKL